MDTVNIIKLDKTIKGFIFIVLMFFGAIYIADFHSLENWKSFTKVNLAIIILPKIFPFFLMGLIIVKFTEGILNLDLSRLVFTFFALLLGNIFLYFLLCIFSENLSFSNLFELESLKFLVGYFIFSLVVWIVNVPIFKEFKAKMLQNAREEDLLQSSIFRSIGYSVAIYFVFTFLNNFFDEKIFHLTRNNVVLVIIIAILFLCFFYFNESKRYRLQAKVKEESQRAENISAQYEGLKSQIDPHFLFNSLNVLSSLIEENPHKAADFTQDLSKIYRYVLENKELEVVDALDEISFAKQYINLLQIRYEDSLQFEIQDELIMPYEKVVPLSLQLLLENAIKHNVVSPQKPLKIKIYKEGNNLIVENNLQKKSNPNSSTQVGLQNIKNRYDLITGRPVVIHETKEHYTVKIPLLTQKTHQMEIINEPKNEAMLKLEKRAAKRAKDLKDFYSHAGTYIIVNLFLFTLNAITSFGHWWFYWPMLGWGIGLLIHAMDTFGFGKEWEQKKKEEIIERETKKWQ